MALTSLRVERRVAVARLLVSSLSCAAIPLDSERSFDTPALWLAGGYAAYALVVAVLLLRPTATPRRPVASWLLDAGSALAAIALNAGRTEPLLPLVAFVLFVARVRWRDWRAVVAAGAMILAFVIVAATAAGIAEAPFAPPPLILQALALALLAGGLIGMTGFEPPLRRALEQFPAPTGATAASPQARLQSFLQSATQVIGARRAVLVWEDLAEPWFSVAEWAPDTGYQCVREPAETFAPLVAQPLAAWPFLCRHAASNAAVTVVATSAGITRWRGTPIHTNLCARFGMDAVVSAGFRQESMDGRVFFLDKRGMTSDDLEVAEALARRVAGELDAIGAASRHANGMLGRERRRIAGDLHDGPFHVLTAIAFEIDGLLRDPALPPGAARDGLRKLQDSLEQGQRDLRVMIDDLRTVTAPARQVRRGLDARLTRLGERMERQWGVQVHCTIVEQAPVLDVIADEIYLIVQEALANVGRHARARRARVTVNASPAQIRIEVADDGRGFGFSGRVDHATLVARELGPWTITNRVERLGGIVTITSDAGSTVLAISLPARRMAA